MASLKPGVVILPSYPERTLSNDTNYKYRQHSEIIYYTGYPESNTTALIQNTGKEITYHLFVPKRDIVRETWDGRRHGVEGAIKLFGADHAYKSEELEEKLFDILKMHEIVYYQTGENPETDNIVISSMAKAVNSKDRKGLGPVNLINPIDIYHKIRSVKSDSEIELCKKSAQLSADAITKAMKKTKPGLKEYQIEALLDYEFRKNGAQRPAYESICGNGVNATILHYIENKDELKSGNLILVDAGAQYEDYCADITRTWPVNGKFSEPQKRIYELVLKIQKDCINMIKPGIVFWDINNYAIKEITKGLVELGLLSGDIDNLIEDKKYVRFYMHTLGHWVGLDVHDTGRIKRETEPMVPGSYVTVEPGIYIPDESDIPDEYRGIGVRIEDDVLVTKTGNTVLTDGVVKEIGDIEKIVGTEISNE
jgi:Xaa-Pro aminopeptidase